MKQIFSSLRLTPWRVIVIALFAFVFAMLYKLGERVDDVDSDVYYKFDDLESQIHEIRRYR